MDKWPYLGNSLTDRHEIRHSDAYWPSEPYWKLEYQTFKNGRWRMAAILKNRKTAISRQWLDRSVQNMAL